MSVVLQVRDHSFQVDADTIGNERAQESPIFQKLSTEVSSLCPTTSTNGIRTATRETGRPLTVLFLDRDGRLYGPVLNFLEDLAVESRFLNLPALEKEVRARQLAECRAKVQRALERGQKGKFCDWDACKLSLSRLDIQGFTFFACILPEADISDLHAQQTKFDRSELEGANFAASDLTGASFIRCNLRSACFRNANLSGANFQGADLTDADLQGADLKGANLASAVLVNANLTNADLSRSAKLADTDLTNANLSRATITGTDLHTARALVGVNLSHVDLSKQNLSGKDLTGANLSSAKLPNTDQTKADLSRVIVTGMDREHDTWTVFVHYQGKMFRVSVHNAVPLAEFKAEARRVARIPEDTADENVRMRKAPAYLDVPKEVLVEREGIRTYEAMRSVDFDILLETREPGEEWTPYDVNTIVVKVAFSRSKGDDFSLLENVCVPHTAALDLVDLKRLIAQHGGIPLENAALFKHHWYSDKRHPVVLNLNRACAPSVTISEGCILYMLYCDRPVPDVLEGTDIAAAIEKAALRQSIVFSDLDSDSFTHSLVISVQSTLAELKQCIADTIGHPPEDFRLVKDYGYKGSVGDELMRLHDPLSRQGISACWTYRFKERIIVQRSKVVIKKCASASGTWGSVNPIDTPGAPDL